MIYKKIIFILFIGFNFFPNLYGSNQNITLRDKLFSAVRNNEKGAVIGLLIKGADPNAQNKFGQTAMGYAVMMDKTDIADVLLEHGGEANSEVTISTFDMGMKVLRQFPLLILAVQKKNMEMVKLLLDYEADVNVHGHKGATGLIIAVNLDLKDMITLLLSKGADINAQMDDGKTALMWSVLRKNKDMISLLLSHGADESLEDKRGKIAFDYAQMVGNKDIISLVKDVPGRKVVRKNQKGIKKSKIGRQIIMYNLIIFLLIIGVLTFFYLKK